MGGQEIRRQDIEGAQGGQQYRQCYHRIRDGKVGGIELPLPPDQQADQQDRRRAHDMIEQDERQAQREGEPDQRQQQQLQPDQALQQAVGIGQAAGGVQDAAHELALNRRRQRAKDQGHALVCIADLGPQILAAHAIESGHGQREAAGGGGIPQKIGIAQRQVQQQGIQDQGRLHAKIPGLDAVIFLFAFQKRILVPDPGRDFQRVATGHPQIDDLMRMRRHFQWKHEMMIRPGPAGKGQGVAGIDPVEGIGLRQTVTVIKRDLAQIRIADFQHHFLCRIAGIVQFHAQPPGRGGDAEVQWAAIAVVAETGSRHLFVHIAQAQPVAIVFKDADTGGQCLRLLAEAGHIQALA